MDGEDRYIDRIDNDKGYSPDNCRFVDNSTNQTNKRVYGKVKYRGVSVLASYLKSPHRICKTFGTVEEAVIFWDSVCWHYERDPDRLNFPDRIEEYNKFDITSI